MPRRRIAADTVSHIQVESQPKGLRAVYLVEAENVEKAAELSNLFEQFQSVLDILQLSTGKLVTYAVQVYGQDQGVLEEIERLLKANFGFVVLHRSFDQLIYDIVRELCKDSGSRLLPTAVCDICGKAEPFPDLVVNLLDEDHTKIGSRTYCATCTAESGGRSHAEFVTSLLLADRGGASTLHRGNLVRNRSSRKRLAFRIKADVEHQYTTG